MNFILKYLPYYKRNLYVAIPIIFSQIGQVLVALIDTKMVGKVGTTELAASAFAGNIFMIAMIFGMGITFGLTPLVGKAFGNGEEEYTQKLFANGVCLNLGSGIMLTLIMLGIIPFMHLMGQPEKVVELARPYYFILVFSMLPVVLFFTFKQFLEGIGNTVIAMSVTLFANVVNVVLNYILIYGKLGMPELGLNGAGIATLVARILMPLIIVICCSQHSKFKNYLKSLKLRYIERKTLQKLFSTGLPIAGQLVVEILLFSLGAVMIGWIGEVPLAAHQIAIGLSGFTFMISVGISSATTIRVSHQLGSGHVEEMRRAAFASLHIVLVFMSLAALAFILFRYPLVALFTEDLEVIEVAASLLLLAAVFQLFDGLQVVALGALRGIADVAKPMVYAFISYIVVSLPISYVCAFVLDIGAEGIWIGFVCGLATASILFVVRFVSKSKEYFH